MKADTATATTSEWHYELVILSNNCYSYARRKRWCSGRGSQPGNKEIESGQELLDALEQADRLEPISKKQVSPGKSIIALFTRTDEESVYHFFRLDGDHWTHKFGGFPVSTCDFDRQPIRWDSLERANMPGFELRSYYRIPRGNGLRHCIGLPEFPPATVP